MSNAACDLNNIQRTSIFNSPLLQILDRSCLTGPFICMESCVHVEYPREAAGTVQSIDPIIR